MRRQADVPGPDLGSLGVDGDGDWLAVEWVEPDRLACHVNDTAVITARLIEIEDEL